MNAETIRQFPLFANLPTSELLNLAELLPERDFAVGDILLHENSSSDYFYLLLDGDAEIVKSLGTPDERILALSKKGSILGEMSMFSKNGTHTASARARTPLTLLQITFEQFNTVLDRHPSLAYDLLRLYSRRLQESENMTILDLREKNIQLTLAYEELKAAQAAMIEKELLEHELQISGEIQRSILPDGMPEYPGLDFGAMMVPARQVGGDFYDFILLDDQRVGIIVGDVCDKGMPAALFMALTYSSVRTEALRQDNPGNTLRAVNQHLLQVNRSSMYVTLLYGIFDCTTGQFEYARAGHPAPLVFDAQNQPMQIPYALGQPIGLFDTPAIDEQCVPIPPGGTLLVYSDGLSETVEAIQGSPALPLFCSTVLDEQVRSAQALCDSLWKTVGGTADVSLIQDDFTLVALQNRMTS